MAYFECIVGNGGGGTDIPLIVTCDEAFAGLTITASQTGQTSLTETCPSSSPYQVVFHLPVDGTWTVSGTVQGSTYSESITISEYELSLRAGFDWKTWVDSSVDLDSTDYSTLADVLADEEAVRELFLVHACVDYMASVASVNTDIETIINNDICAKWINLSDYALDTLYANSAIATAMDTADKYFYGEWVITDDTTTPPTWGPKGNVPVMTSNTAPYGTVSANAATSSKPAYYAFDGNDSTTWGDNSTASGSDAYIQYSFTNPVCVKKFYFYINSGSVSRVSSVKIIASNDGSNWTEALNSDTSVGTGQETKAVTNSNYYLHYRVVFRKAAAQDINLQTLQFYGRELKVSVPAMTSNTAPYGEVIRSSEYGSNYAPWKAFNGTLTDAYDSWASKDQGLVNQWLGYKFGKKVNVKKVKISNSNYSNPNAIKNFNVEGSNDNGSTWEVLGTFLNPANTSQFTTYFDLESDKAFKQIRINALSPSYSASGGLFIIGECQFYGLDYSEKEFEQGSTKKWLYDHGVELEELTYGGSSYKLIAENDGESIHLKSSNGASGVFSVYAELANFDFSDYDLIRATVGDVLNTTSTASNGRCCSLAIYNIGTTSNSVASKAIEKGSSILPNNISLDVSSLNTSYDFYILDSNNGAAESKVKELWLE